MNDETEDGRELGIDRVDQELRRRLLNVLTEAPFFYVDDDPDLFQTLRRRKAAFAEFFKKYFGWELLVDEQCARLLKRGNPENKALLSSQVDAFTLTRRNQCIVFALLLEYFEVEARRTNWDRERDGHLKFFHHEFVGYARNRFSELLGERAPEDAGLQRDIRDTWDILKRYRFIRYIEPTPAEILAGVKGSELYEFLPAVYLYDSHVLSDASWIENLRAAPDGSQPAEEVNDAAAA